MKIPRLYYCIMGVMTVSFLTACSTTETKTSEMGTEERFTSVIETLKGALDQKSTLLSQREMELKESEKAEMNAQSEALAAKERAMQLEQQMATFQTKTPEMLLPPSAKGGECYARVFVEPVYQTVTETVLKRAESSRFEIIPAKFETVSEQILVSEASSALEVVPATYGWVEEQVLVSPSSQQIVEIPARYKTVSENILVKPAHTIWKKGRGPIQKINEATGEIMCLVEIPASYKTVKKRVVDSPATTKLIEIPAKYKSMKKRVMKTPPTTRTVEIPAKYKTIKVARLVSPEKKQEVTIPAEFQTVSRQELVKEGHMEWRSILCETNMTRDRISAIQTSLKDKGYNTGPIDGIIGRRTMSAVNAFQREKGLPVDKYLNISTIEALGVSPN